MKKLMFGAVALAAAVSFAEITSTNVVGYMNDATFKGNQAVGACFVPVVGEGKMADVTITGYGDEYGDTRISCGKLDTYGRSIARMYWFDLPEDPVEGWAAQYGWFDAQGEAEFNDEDLNAGESLWVNCGETGITINFPSPLAATK